MAEYIEREALANFLKEEIQQCEAELIENGWEDDRYEQAVESRMLGLVEVWRKVTNTTTADVVEVRHGEWIELVRELGKGKTITKYQCSLCGVYLVQEANYCPNCGAKMDGKGEGE